jgi:hypothetical protein
MRLLWRRNGIVVTPPMLRTTRGMSSRRTCLPHLSVQTKILDCVQGGFYFTPFGPLRHHVGDGGPTTNKVSATHERCGDLV